MVTFLIGYGKEFEFNCDGKAVEDFEWGSSVISFVKKDLFTAHLLK